MGHILPLDLGNVKVVRNLMYYPSSRSKSAQNVDLEKDFPRFGVLVLKHSLLLTDFPAHSFLFPPKSASSKDPLYLYIKKIYDKNQDDF